MTDEIIMGEAQRENERGELCLREGCQDPEGEP
jgi:hypothetical protein